MVAHDWEAMAACVGDDVERVGPFCDVYRGKQRYVAFISDLMPQLGGYAMKIDRVTYAGHIAVAELTESVDGTDTPEALVFDLDGSGLISRVAIYIQRPELGALGGE
ncbi:MAG: ketosteroid isomerase-like protein [Acidimicrobiales bacterium]|nr:ketosteroid isomerase-like protein [Acidimicrobiales bacterium]